jgi:putative ABC transport system ATP-binding protein
MKIKGEAISVVYNLGEPNETSALVGCDFELVSGEPLVVTGPNGSGKTTLLKVLSGTIVQSSGTIRVSDGEVERVAYQHWLRKNSEYVPQRPADGLFPELTLIENLALRVAPGERGFFDPYRESAPFKRSEERLAQILSFYLAQRHRRLLTLSGGEQQAFALALAEHRARPLVLLDEPTAALDENTLQRVEERLALWLRRSTVTAVLVTHDRDVAQRLGFRSVGIREIESRKDRDPSSHGRAAG